ncbi:AbrB/MazE/SpoVT family DNA-binding domain-containing protein [Polymorphobacter fuscus]|uniref:AbrB/MazE/SpoVT family DNA-binding domain-containing protein n=1 Tax=Sandarakinorhabdus fusca TaxID=1439888 RepID=A0A7C9GN17_9SPHN|nr:AbrB/MazE/SpoVT family DNA-binding domain-containing protein [Polymorphobacter fuscus]KAB7648854.1 AbrB/MazE/SpoVT family DNA-binding domain-containing protein [Polymorphobacter fuscus]MQT16437.1 AbrB/MazE/SpoVT family DNA-binding domain-containing protein [Polymorphobacter fuscus]NJC07273.1 antitoxin PrlF [Polymorphobacter fuscus]
MGAEFSRLTGKYQATVPAGVRRTLGVGAGDRLAWEVDGDVVILRRAPSVDDGFAAALSDTMSEWSTAEDEAAWRDL